MNDINVIELLRNTGLVNRLILLVLLIFSVWSWGIILSKVMHFRKVRQESELFWKIFRKGQSLSEIATACETLRFSPLVPVFNAGIDLLQPGNSRTASQGSLALKTA